MTLILFAIIGLIVGWIAGFTLERRGLGPAGDILVGGLGALVGGLFASAWTVTTFSFWMQMLLALIGAVIALGIASFIRNDRPIIHV